MLQTQVDYWKLVEQKRHNLVDEMVARQNAASNERTSLANVKNADTNVRNADTNVENARINALNASANLENAKSNARQATAAERNAESNARQATAAERNAVTNETNAVSNRISADANMTNAISRQKEVRFNTLDGVPQGIVDSYSRAGGLLKAAEAEEKLARADYYTASAEDTRVQIDPKKLKTQTEAAKNIADTVKSGVMTIGSLPMIISDWKLLTAVP